MKIPSTPYELLRHQTGFELVEGSQSIGYFDTPNQLYEYLEQCLTETECREQACFSPLMYGPVLSFREAFQGFVNQKPFKSIEDLN